MMVLTGIILTGCRHTVQDNNPGIKDDYRDIAEVDHYKKWGPYNIHDPSVIFYDGHYYVYSTDAYHFYDEGKGPERREKWKTRRQKMDSLGFGNIPVRRSNDLVHWEFVGWAFDSIPEEAIKHIETVSGGKRPRNIWAPYIFKWKKEFRLYYAVSLFGRKTSCIGLAKSNSPEGPWKQCGFVVTTSEEDIMNAIDPSVVADPVTGKHWMHYGSYFGGLFCVELDPETGLTLHQGDKGHLVARRAHYKIRNLEAPEIIYNPEFKKYYLFTSYDALFTHYNVRVGRSDSPEGPFFDYFEKDLADTTDNYPILTYAYRFSGHPGWAGVGHCAVINNQGNYFMLHQGRLAPDNLPLVLHVRKILWTSDGWPVVSPERFANIPQQKIKEKDITGNWEIIRLNEVADSVKLWQGQIPDGGWHYDTSMFNNPVLVCFEEKGLTKNFHNLTWTLQGNKLYLENKEEKTELMLFNGWDWENQNETILFTGLQKNGIGIYGKKR